MYLGVGDIGTEKTSINNKKRKSYIAWSSMLDRCYSKASQTNQPAYIGCTVCKDWLYYPNFIEWFDDNYKEGFQLDKDLKNIGARIYNPENCSFIPSEINSLTISCKSSRGDLPIGVVLHKNSGLMMSKIKEYGKTIHLGCFKCKVEAFNAYRERKLMHIIKIANASYARGDICDRVFTNLIKWDIKIDD